MLTTKGVFTLLYCPVGPISTFLACSQVKEAVLQKALTSFWGMVECFSNVGGKKYAKGQDHKNKSFFSFVEKGSLSVNISFFSKYSKLYSN